MKNKTIEKMATKIFGKSEYADQRTPEEKYLEYLNEQINIEEQIAEKKIQLELLKKIDSTKVNELLENADLDEFFASIITVKLAEKMASKAQSIVNNGTYNLENNNYAKQAIKLFCINTIRKAFGQEPVDSV